MSKLNWENRCNTYSAQAGPLRMVIHACGPKFYWYVFGESVVSSAFGVALSRKGAKRAAEAAAAEILTDGLRALGKDRTPRLLCALEALVAQAEAHISYPCPELEEAKATLAAAKGEK